VSWNAATGATDYNVKIGTTTTGPWTTVATTTATGTTVTGLTNGTNYYFVVSSLDSSGESMNSTPVAGKPLAPVVPTGLTAPVGSQQVTVAWAPSARATGYNLKKGTTTTGPWTTVATTTGTSAIATGLTNGTKYYFVVSALSSSGESANSTYVLATPLAPAAPSGLVAVAGSQQVSI